MLAHMKSRIRSRLGKMLLLVRVMRPNSREWLRSHRRRVVDSLQLCRTPQSKTLEILSPPKGLIELLRRS